MMRLKFSIFIFAVFLALTYSVAAQTNAMACPAGQVCLDQSTANDIYKKLSDLVAAKDLINKMLSERNASDATVAAANQLIASYKEQDAINGQIVLKYKDMTAVYEQVIKMEQQLIANLTAQINKPKSAFQKLVDFVEKAAILLAGVTLGRGL